MKTGTNKIARGIIAVVIILFLAAFFSVVSSVRLPAPELRAEIETDMDWFHGDSVYVYRAGETYFVDWDRAIDMINYEETMTTLGYLVGCAARAIPNENGELCMRTSRVDCKIPLRDCIILYRMSVDGEGEDEILSYMDSVVVFVDR